MIITIVFSEKVIILLFKDLRGSGFMLLQSTTKMQTVSN